METGNHLKTGQFRKAIRVGLFNCTIMKTSIKISVALCVFFILTSFSSANYDPIKIHFRDSKHSELWNSNDEVNITYKNSDVCGLKYIGETEVTEKWWFYNNNDLKKETISTLKKQAFEKGGNIVFVDIKEKKGFGIFYTTVITGYIYTNK